MIVILVGMEWYLVVVLICISLVANNVEHHFICLIVLYLLYRNVFIEPLPILKFYLHFYYASRYIDI